MEGGGALWRNWFLPHTPDRVPPQKTPTRYTQFSTHTHRDDRLHTRAAANLHMHKVDGRSQTCAHMCGHTCVKRGRVAGRGAGDGSVI